MSLQKQITAWDGRDTAVMQRVYERYATGGHFLTNVVELAHQPEAEVGATWLLKHALEQDAMNAGEQHANCLAAADIASLCRLMPRLQHWEGQLHVLQCMRYIAVPARQASIVERFLSACLASEKKFVRAWAYDGYYRLAQSHPKYRAEAMSLLEDGLAHDPAASVKARIRNLMKDSKGTS